MAAAELQFRYTQTEVGLLKILEFAKQEGRKWGTKITVWCQAYFFGGRSSTLAKNCLWHVDSDRRLREDTRGVCRRTGPEFDRGRTLTQWPVNRARAPMR